LTFYLDFLVGICFRAFLDQTKILGKKILFLVRRGRKEEESNREQQPFFSFLSSSSLV